MSPLFEKLRSPVLPEGEVFMLRAVLSDIDAEARVKQVILDRALGPADIDAAQIDPVRALGVPFYRVEVTVDGHHVGFSGVTVGSGTTRIPIPTGGARSKDASVVIAARGAFPYEARAQPPILNRWFEGSAPLAIERHDLVSAGAAPDFADAEFARDAEMVDMDVTRQAAEEDAKRILLRTVAPTNAFYSTYKAEVRATQLVYVPVYYVHYEYTGEAKRHAGERCYVVLSAASGNVIACHHPSALRAAAAKVRRILSFDF